MSKKDNSQPKKVEEKESSSNLTEFLVPKKRREGRADLLIRVYKNHLVIDNGKKVMCVNSNLPSTQRILWSIRENRLSSEFTDLLRSQQMVPPKNYLNVKIVEIKDEKSQNKLSSQYVETVTLERRNGDLTVYIRRWIEENYPFSSAQQKLKIESDIVNNIHDPNNLNLNPSVNFFQKANLVHYHQQKEFFLSRVPLKTSVVKFPFVGKAFRCINPSSRVQFVYPHLLYKYIIKNKIHENPRTPTKPILPDPRRNSTDQQATNKVESVNLSPLKLPLKVRLSPRRNAFRAQKSNNPFVSKPSRNQSKDEEIFPEGTKELFSQYSGDPVSRIPTPSSLVENENLEQNSIPNNNFSTTNGIPVGGFPMDNNFPSTNGIPVGGFPMTPSDSNTTNNHMNSSSTPSSSQVNNGSTIRKWMERYSKMKIATRHLLKPNEEVRILCFRDIKQRIWTFELRSFYRERRFSKQQVVYEARMRRSDEKTRPSLRMSVGRGHACYEQYIQRLKDLFIGKASIVYDQVLDIRTYMRSIATGRSQHHNLPTPSNSTQTSLPQPQQYRNNHDSTISSSSQQQQLQHRQQQQQQPPPIHNHRSNHQNHGMNGNGFVPNALCNSFVMDSRRRPPLELPPSPLRTPGRGLNFHDPHRIFPTFRRSAASSSSYVAPSTSVVPKMRVPSPPPPPPVTTLSSSSINMNSTSSKKSSMRKTTIQKKKKKKKKKKKEKKTVPQKKDLLKMQPKLVIKNFVPTASSNNALKSVISSNTTQIRKKNIMYPLNGSSASFRNGF